jgi:hypothetical protein
MAALLHGAALWPFPIAERGVAGLAEWLDANRITIYASSASLFRAFVKTLGAAERFAHVRLVRLSSEPAMAEDFRAALRHFPQAAAFAHTLASSETGNIAQLRLGRDAAVAEGRLPIGRPPEGVEILLLDADGRAVAPGEVGEIVVRSRHMAAGYWRNPALTAARFRPVPGDGERRSFHSGDLGRWRPDGLLEFAGRNDDRVKIRGYRIELSEVEEAVLRLPGVAAGAVCVRARPPAEAQLVAFVVAEGEPPTATFLREALRDHLPEHMLPSAVVLLDALPLTPHGKIDRAQLQAMVLPEADAGLADAPRSDSERRLAAIWTETLALARVGRSGDFFQLGGDSLIAAVIAAKVHAALGVELHLASFVDHPTLAALARAIDDLRARAPAEEPALAHVTREGPAPVSFIQEQIWRHSRDPGAAAGYTIANCDDIAGPLDAGLLRDCLSAIVARHEILRTSIGTLSGQPVQIVHAAEPVDLPLHDLAPQADAEAQAERVLHALSAHVFDCARAPLVRFALIRLAAERHWLVCFNHHVISDGWSRRVLLRELAHLYAAGRRGEAADLPAPLQYADYATWLRATLRPDGAAYAARIAWWMRQMVLPPATLALPFRRPGPGAPVDPARGRLARRLDAETSRRLHELRRREGVTDYVVWLATLVALLAEACGRTDLVIGTYVTTRGRLALQDMLGCFISLAALRFACDLELGFHDWLAAVRGAVIAAEGHADIPFEPLREELRARAIAVPEITAIFSDSYRRDHMRFGDLSLVRKERADPAMPWGFSVAFEERAGVHGIRVSFDVRLYDPDDVAAFIDRFCRLLDVVSRNGTLRLRELLAMSAAIAPVL